MTNLTINGLQRLYKQCVAKATPHREPDFELLREHACNGGDTIIKGRMVFIEEHNTGYDGVLYRYLMKVEDKQGRPLNFQVDLLPDQVTEIKE